MKPQDHHPPTPALWAVGKHSQVPGELPELDQWSQDLRGGLDIKSSDSWTSQTLLDEKGVEVLGLDLAWG